MTDKRSGVATVGAANAKKHGKTPTARDSKAPATARKVGKSTVAAGNRGKGRKKGVPNKITASVKEAITLAFAGIGGVEELTLWAKGNQTEFYKLWGRMLPLDVKHSGDDTFTALVAKAFAK